NGFWQPQNEGDYNNPMQRGRAFEREVSVELLNSSGVPGFNTNCGIRVQGSGYHRPRYTRDDNWVGYNKFSFKLFFRSDYGDGRLNYQMFPSTQHDSYDRIVLRGGHNDMTNPFIKDELIRRLQKDMSGVAGVGSFANLFINGEYKGFYNSSEYLDEEFMQTWYGGDLEWDVITHRTVRDGDDVAWLEMQDFFVNNDLSMAANYQAAGDRLDIEQFIDYLIVEIYCGNWDWPANNWTAARERSSTGKFRFFVWDAEGAMDSWAVGAGFDKTAFDDFPNWWWWSPNGLNNLYNDDPISKLLYHLRVNDDFKQLFADRVQRAFYNSGALANANVLARFYELRDEVAGIVPNMDAYIPDSFVPGRRTPMLDKFVAEGLYYYSTPAPVLNINGAYQHGGIIQYGDLLTITKSSPGTIYFTLNGIDPRSYGGAIDPAAIAYSSSVTLNEHTNVKARVYNSGQWSPLIEADYTVPLGIVINEVLAHSDTVAYDWIELYNTTSVSIDIGGWFLSDSGPDDPNLMKYEIAAGETITGHGYKVFYENLHFGAASSDPGRRIPFALSENGETVYLSSGSGGVLGGYREVEDFGASLGDVSMGRYTKSAASGYDVDFVAMSSRTAGSANSAPKVGPIVISEIMYNPHPDHDAEYVELINISGSAVTLFDATTNEPWKFVDDYKDKTPGIEFYFPTTTPITMAAGERILLVKNLAAFNTKFGTPAVQILEWGAGNISNSGERLQLSMPGDIDGAGERQYIRVDRVNFGDGSHPEDYPNLPGDPWPTSPDGLGSSLNRVSDSSYGNDVANWQGSTPSPGS
ncbi:MAG: lamin tail domain-containing protein, partial [Planctomycetota bacterium]